MSRHFGKNLANTVDSKAGGSFRFREKRVICYIQISTYTEYCTGLNVTGDWGLFYPPKKVIRVEIRGYPSYNSYYV